MGVAEETFSRDTPNDVAPKDSRLTHGCSPQPQGWSVNVTIMTNGTCAGMETAAAASLTVDVRSCAGCFVQTSLNPDQVGPTA